MEAPQGPSGDFGPGLIQSLWRFRWAVVTVTLIAGAAAGGLSYLQPVRYEATARLFLADPSSTGVFDEARSGSTDAARHAQNQAELVTTRPVAEHASELIDGRLNASDLLEMVEAQASSDFDMVTIRALDVTPERAAELATAVGVAYQDVIADEVRAAADETVARLRQSADELENRIADIDAELRERDNAVLRSELDSALAQHMEIQQRANQLAIDSGPFESGVRLFERAEAPTERTQPKPLRNTAFGLVLGLMSASAFAYWRAGHSRRAEDRHDPAGLLDAPLLGEIPDFRAVGARGPIPLSDTPQSAAVEAYELILASLEFILQENDARSFLLTSPLAGDGKTTTAVNIAVAARRDGRSLFLVDADQRVRGLSRLAGQEREPGLTDLGDIALPANWCITSWEPIDGLAVSMVPAGTARGETGSFFRTRYFRTAMDRLQEQSRLVIVDSPPILAVADTSAIASQVDGIVLVVNHGTPLHVLTETRERLEFVGTPLFGYVFNRAVPQRGLFTAYGYGDGGREDRSSESARTRRRRARHLERSA